MKVKTILIIDGSNLIYRAFHTNNLKNKKGERIGGAFGAVKMTLNLLKKFNPDICVMAWDAGRSPARLAKYPEYKAQREKQRKPEDVIDIKNNIKVCQEIFKHLPVRQIVVQDMEGDDIIGYLCCKLKGKKIIVSNDHDFIQLVKEDTSVFLPTVIKTITLENAQDFLGVPVDKYLIYKAIVGDTSDNISGIFRVGPVKAAKIINENEPFPKDWLTIIERNIELMNIGLLMTKQEMNAVVKNYNEEITKPIDAMKVRMIFERHNFKSLLFNFASVKFRFGQLRKNKG